VVLEEVKDSFLSSVVVHGFSRVSKEPKSCEIVDSWCDAVVSLLSVRLASWWSRGVPLMLWSVAEMVMNFEYQLMANSRFGIEGTLLSEGTEEIYTSAGKRRATKFETRLCR
jgi:hypothetical protein